MEAGVLPTVVGTVLQVVFEGTEQRQSSSRESVGVGVTWDRRYQQDEHECRRDGPKGAPSGFMTVEVAIAACLEYVVCKATRHVRVFRSQLSRPVKSVDGGCSDSSGSDSSRKRGGGEEAHSGGYVG